MTTRIEKPGRGSRAARVLARSLGVLTLRRPTRYRPAGNDTIINWGCTEQRFDDRYYLNKPRNVAVACNKRDTYRTLGDLEYVPRNTCDAFLAQEWLGEGRTLLARHTLTGYGGAGMELVTPDHVPDVLNAPLYVEYVKKQYEYRVHVVGGRPIHVQQKRLRDGVEKDDMTFKIRNANRGWVFCIEDVVAPDAVLASSVEAVELLGLDFGAVDIGWNTHYQRATMYEVNTAPGLNSPTCIEAYVRAFREIME